ncbi:MAG TPA: hypothetical protein DEB40_06380 [Elusimicrobia bacterium]|nr:hypothetical protein [Elusimicrobiota bacterium]HBT61353.1 hypothetical protein [Elusimicrobiota bacterium]
MERPEALALVRDVRDFLSGLRCELPELFAPGIDRVKPPVETELLHRGDPVRELFAARVRHWSGIMGVAPRRVFLKNQRTLWGSCSARGNLNFNRALAEAPPEVMDYVVIHELAHLREMNHSSRFWNIVGQWCPEHKQRRRWLRRNGVLLTRRGAGGAVMPDFPAEAGGCRPRTEPLQPEACPPPR